MNTLCPALAFGGRGTAALPGSPASSAAPTDPADRFTPAATPMPGEQPARVCAPLTSNVNQWLAAVLRPINKVFLNVFFRPEIVGRENIPASGPVLLAPTHQSMFDAQVVASLSDRDMHFMAAAEQMKGLRGWILRNCGAFPVDRRNPCPEVVAHSKDVLRNGDALVLFPEGGIHTDGKVHPLKPGAGAIATGAPADSVIPIAIHYQPRPWLGSRLKVLVGKPIPTASYIVEGKSGATRLTSDLATALAAQKASLVETVIAGAPGLPPCEKPAPSP